MPWKPEAKAQLLAVMTTSMDDPTGSSAYVGLKRPLSAQGEPQMHTEAATPVHAQTAQHVLLDTFRDDVEASPLLNLVFHDNEVDPWRVQFKEIHDKWTQRKRDISSAADALSRMRAAVSKADIDVESRHDPNQQYLVPSAKACLLSIVDASTLTDVGLVAPSQYLNAPAPPRPRPKRPQRPTFTMPTTSSTQKLQGATQGQADWNIRGAQPAPPMTAPPQDRAAARQAVGHFHRKTKGFLRNPRFAETAPTKVSTIKGTREFNRSLRSLNGTQRLVKTANGQVVLEEVFRATPSRVIFSSYEVGETYRQTITLRNMTELTRKARLVPPATKAFRIVACNFPAGGTNLKHATSKVRAMKDSEQGRVAAGLIIEVIVEFTPTERKHYEDVITVTPEAGVAFRIPLEASANPANVTVQDRLALRPVVVGESSSDQVKVVNSGGSGRFRWCQEEFVSTLLKDFNAETAMPTSLTLEPETFSLAANAKTIVQVSFTSSCEEELKTTLCLVTEGSETVQRMDISCQCTRPRLSLTLSGGHEVVPDVSKHHLVSFPAAHPKCETSMALVIFNESDVPCRVRLSLPESKLFSIQLPLEMSDEQLDPRASVSCVLQFRPEDIGNATGSCTLYLDDQVYQSFDLVGQCIPFTVAVSPPCVVVGGQISLEAPFRRSFQLANTSGADVSFEWPSQFLAAASLNVHPSTGSVPANSSRTLELVISPRQSGTVEAELEGKVVDGPRLALPIFARVAQPVVSISVPLLDFGVCRLGETSTCQFSLQNEAQVPVAYALRADDKGIRFSPPCGQLAPFAAANVSATYTASTLGAVEGVVTCCVGGGQATSVFVKGVVDEPSAYLSSCTVTHEELFANVAASHSVDLINSSRLPIRFAFDHAAFPCSTPSVSTETSFSPMAGEVGVGERVPITVSTTATNPGVVDQVYLCRVEGTKVVVPMRIQGSAKGVQLAFHEPENDADATCIDFGRVDIRQSVTKTLVVVNKSGIPATLRLKTVGFPAAEAVMETSARDFSQTMPSGIKPSRGKMAVASTLRRTQQGVSFASTMRASGPSTSQIRRGMGVAFVPADETLFVEPFASIDVNVTCYSDLWGKYSDLLQYQVNDEEPMYLPIVAEVVGSPVVPQLSGASSATVVRLPCVPTASSNDRLDADPSSISSRNVRVKNCATLDVLVQWESYSVSDTDTQLIDFLCDVDDDGVVTRVRTHEGQKSDIPFQILSEPCIVPAHKTGSVDVSFASVTAGEFHGFVRGVVSLASASPVPQLLPGLPNDLSRNIGVVRDTGETESMALLFFVHGRSVKPVLETNLPNERLELTCAVDDIHSLGKDAEKRRSTHLVLKNPTRATLTFQAVVDPPLVVASPALGLDNDDYTYSLKPQENMGLTITLDCDSAYIQERDPTTTSGLVAWESSLRFAFTSGVVQSVPIDLAVHLPNVKLSSPKLDFGTCPIRTPVVKSITVSNAGLASVDWELVGGANIEVETIKDEDCATYEECLAAFSLDPNQGHLDAFETKLSRSSTVISVVFTPDQVLTYRCKLLCRLSRDLPPLELELEGAGTMVRRD